ncbi:MAG: M10 family metallopeptidase C-terminal domain-containing protein, partial [Hyphomonadaceae bacterium]|nr:M10 family metallopeptidase C-terminal domain-containing protein [Hyphomonadaceae bacterium]
MSFALNRQADATTGFVGDAYTGCGCPICGGGVAYDGPQGFMPPGSGVAANGLPIFSWDQAAAQITRPSASWATGLGQAATVTYGFRLNEPTLNGQPNMPNGTAGFIQFTQVQIEATVMILGLWSDVANITFVRVGTGSTTPDAYTDTATMLFANYTSGATGASAFAYYPGSTAADAVQGDVWINFSLASNTNLTFGTFGPHTISHEIGHAIGLAHPANYDALNGNPTYPESSVYWQDSRAYTVMSYFGSGGVGHSLNAFAAGPQLHDIAAAQRLYGANMTVRTGDTTYGFNSNTGLVHFTITFDGQSPVFSIWDAGGLDTIDFSGYSTATEIDLREESFSSAGPGNSGVGIAIGNISIARGTVIENAIGGSANDVITGNGAANTLIGNGGNDRFFGNLGDDAINGGIGFDTAAYALADSTSASWSRNPDGTWSVTAGAEGTDTLTSV